MRVNTKDSATNEKSSYFSTEENENYAIYTFCKSNNIHIGFVQTYSPTKSLCFYEKRCPERSYDPIFCTNVGQIAVVIILKHTYNLYTHQQKHIGVRI